MFVCATSSNGIRLSIALVVYVLAEGIVVFFVAVGALNEFTYSFG